MTKPDTAEMDNRTAINEGFRKERSADFLVGQEFADDFKQICQSNERYEAKPRLSNGEFVKEFQLSDITPGNVLTLTGYRNIEQLLTLTPQQQQQVAFRGRTIVDLNTLHNYKNTSYERQSSDERSYEEERVTLTRNLWGWPDPTERYPFNTVLITNDLLLHVYHKLFDNSLKYYEEQIARPALTTLSEKLYQQYLNLAQQEQNAELQSIYQFLTAYRAVPHILLPTNQAMIEASSLWSSAMQEYQQADITDEQIQQIIKERTQTISKTLAPTYQILIPDIIEKILEATNIGQDDFLAVLAQDFLSQPGVDIKQDYTQFKPRAHYTDSSLLKTYFMAMKRLMREKFYFGSTQLTKAALVMTTTINATDVTELNQLSEQIKNLIGSDDDLTFNSLTTRAKERNYTDPTLIVTSLTEQEIKELAALHPQKIQSTTYETFCVECIEEEQAKQMTDGFVFFGEKFTLDSYLFDLTTAGSAETEFAFKPNVQTALITPSILEDNALADQLIQLRLAEKTKEINPITNQPYVLEDENHTQRSNREQFKTEIKTIVNELLEVPLDKGEGAEGGRGFVSDITNNIYHKRLQMLGILIQAPLENAPYFRLDPLYTLKNLLTYMGSYTELKHDTLLYVKQAYAEMGAGGIDGCDIYVEKPHLPVPKGYVESEPDFLDRLMKLNAETLPYFADTYEQSKFVEFGNVLQKLKEISIKQMHNETISDEDFERLRLLANYNLGGIVIPTRTIGEPIQKEMRGALIADIFTSEWGNPLYQATGRPALMLLMVNDTNGARVVLGPVFTHYEFYGSNDIIPNIEGRYTDEDRQEQLQNEEGTFRTPAQENRSNAGLSIISRELQKWLEKAE